MPLLGRFFEVYSIMTEKQRLKPKNSSSLSFDLEDKYPFARITKYMDCRLLEFFVDLKQEEISKNYSNTI